MALRISALLGNSLAIHTPAGFPPVSPLANAAIFKISVFAFDATGSVFESALQNDSRLTSVSFWPGCQSRN